MFETGGGWICHGLYFIGGTNSPFLSPESPPLQKVTCSSSRELPCSGGVEVLTMLYIFEVWTVIQICWAQPIACPGPPQGDVALITSINDCRRFRYSKIISKMDRHIFYLKGVSKYKQPVI